MEEKIVKGVLAEFGCPACCTDFTTEVARFCPNCGYEAVGLPAEECGLEATGLVEGSRGGFAIGGFDRT